MKYTTESRHRSLANLPLITGQLSKISRAQTMVSKIRSGGMSQFPISLLHKKPSKEPVWLKDIDVSRALENLLVGAIVFLGRFPITAFHLLFIPSHIDKRLFYDASLKTIPQVSSTRPLTFLVISLFLYVVFMLTTIGNVPPFSFFLDFFKQFIDKIQPSDVKSLSLEKIGIYMLPGAAIVGLMAVVSFRISQILRCKTSFKAMLNIHAYYIGLLSFTIAVQALLLYPSWELIGWAREHAKGHWFYAAPLVISGFAFVSAVILIFAQLLLRIKAAIGGIFWKAIMIITVSWPLSLTLAWGLLYFLSPIFGNVSAK